MEKGERNKKRKRKKWEERHKEKNNNSVAYKIEALPVHSFATLANVFHKPDETGIRLIITNWKLKTFIWDIKCDFSKSLCTL